VAAALLQVVSSRCNSQLAGDLLTNHNSPTNEHITFDHILGMYRKDFRAFVILLCFVCKRIMFKPSGQGQWEVVWSVGVTSTLKCKCTSLQSVGWWLILKSPNGLNYSYFDDSTPASSQTVTLTGYQLDNQSEDSEQRFNRSTTFVTPLLC